MRISVDPQSPEPPFEQVKRHLREAIDTGELHPGDRLPTVRRLAADLELAPNTVARAYRELEALGALHTRGRAGTFVAGDEIERAAREAAASYVAKIRSLGLDAQNALELVTRQLEMH